MKDRFSENSQNYLKYRPGYPEELFNFLLKIVGARNRAWDCGTGNGQVAVKLAEYFEQVYATDISVPQLMNAGHKPNIHYTRQRAERTNFPSGFFDLVTVAQAIHWFDFDKFYSEVHRTLVPGGLLAVIGYGLFRSNTATNEVIDYFYREVVGSYWDKERRYLDDHYTSIPFPFDEIQTPEFYLQMEWTLERLKGYLGTWSSVQKYRHDRKTDPLSLVEEKLEEAFGERGHVNFPILLRVGIKA